MQSLSLHSSATRNEPPDLAAEVLRLENILIERRAELTALQEAFQHFKARYTQSIGSRLAELAEVEQAIREAETHRLGIEPAVEEEDEAEAVDGDQQTSDTSHVGKSLRKLFWSVARMFHPDMAADEREARRRHAVMVEASRAYREGDVDSLHTLLGDEELHFFCTSAHAQEGPEDMQGRAVALKEEIRTIEFGIKRIKQDSLYQLKLRVDAEAANGRDALAAQAEQINRQIAKARRRLAHLA